MKRNAIGLAITAVLLVCAKPFGCGGKVVVDSSPSSTSGGAGGAGGTMGASTASTSASASSGLGGFGSGVTSGTGGSDCGPKPLGTPVAQCFPWGGTCPSVDDAWSHMPYCCPEGFTITQIVDGPKPIDGGCCYDVIWAGNCSSGLEK